MKKIMAYMLSFALILGAPAFGFPVGAVDIVSAATVVPVPSVTSVTVSPASAVVAQGSSVQLSATVVVVDAADKAITWTGSNSNLTVNGTGFVTVASGASAGVYTITATSNVDSNKKDSSQITVPASIPVLANMTTYNAALTAKVETDFTTASWTAYQAVVASNVVTSANTQAQVNAATLAITTAQGFLVPYTTPVPDPVTPSAPTVIADDTANKVIGMTLGMEYNLDASGYQIYDATLFRAINFSDNHTLLIRIASEGINPFGPATTLIFTTNPVVIPGPVDPGNCDKHDNDKHDNDKDKHGSDKDKHDNDKDKHDNDKDKHDKDKDKHDNSNNGYKSNHGSDKDHN